jgi:hypothetical protein
MVRFCVECVTSLAGKGRAGGDAELNPLLSLRAVALASSGLTACSRNFRLYSRSSAVKSSSAKMAVLGGDATKPGADIGKQSERAQLI